MIARFACVALFATHLAGCARDSGPRAALPADSVGAAASGAETFFRYGLVDTGRTRAELQSKLGAPDSVTSRAVQNRHQPAVTDSILIVHYSGLAVEIYLATQGSKELAQSIRASDNRFIQTTAPIRIGMSEADLATLMGPPGSTTGGVLSWACTTCTELGNEHVEVRLDGGRVGSVTIVYSID